MKSVEIMKLLTDELRVRIMMLLDKKELSVCQIMGITGASQPLVSHNLSLLYRGGFLEERRDGKLRFYSIRRDLPEKEKAALVMLKKMTETENTYMEDLETLKECSEFQKRKGTCDMKTLKEFMEWKRKKKLNSKESDPGRK